MKIASFNINNIRRRLANLLAWLKAAEPDIACLQELKTTDAEFPAEALRRAGYQAAWRGQKSWNGVAILARGTTPIVTRTELPGDSSDRQSRYIEAAISGVLVACVYAPNGNPQPGPKFDYKLAWMRRLAGHASELFRLDAPAVLAGDFNVVPTAQDIYPTRSWDKDALLQPESRQAYAQLLEQGWVDCVRALHPGEAMFTFWDYMRRRWERDAGMRLDQILLNARAAPALRASGVDRAVRGEPEASDHAPVWAELGTLPKPGRTASSVQLQTSRSRTRNSSARPTTRRSPAPDAAGAASAAGDRRRFLRASRIPRASKVHPPRRQPRRRRDPRLREFPAAVLPDGIAARRAGGVGHAHRADLPARAVPRLSERANVRR